MSDYSYKLSGRIKDVWARRRAAAADGRKYQAVKPFWCDWDQDQGNFILNDQAEIPRLMVQLSIEGMGMTQIAQHLNSNGYCTSTGKTFTYAWVRKILADRRLLGEQRWEGDVAPLQGYFPAIVSEADWERCWNAINNRRSLKGKVGRGTYIHNLFQGVIHCECGGALTFITTYNRRRDRQYSYLRCMGKVSGTCTASRKNPVYDEEWLLRTFMEQRWSSFFSRPTNNKQRRQLEVELLELESKLSQQQERAALADRNKNELLASGKLDVYTTHMISQSAQAVQQQATDIARHRHAVQLKLNQLTAQPTGQEAAQQVRHRIAAFMAGDREHLERRRKFNNWLHTLGLRVVLETVQDRWLMSLQHMHTASSTSRGPIT